jgi:hypothetical protein
MKASELRIGNWVNCLKIVDGDKIREISCWDFGTYLSTNPEYYSPIQLTEEWLEKFGFEKQDYNMSGCDIYKLKNIIIMKSFVNPERKNMGITVEGISPPTWSLADLYFVHQLQNLYFALTGEELILKE